MTVTVQETATVQDVTVSSVTVGAWQLREALASAVIASETGHGALPVLAGVCIEWGDGVPLTVAGTDRYRLIMVETGTTGQGAARMIVSRGDVLDLIKALPKRGKRDHASTEPAITLTVTARLGLTVRADGPLTSWSRELVTVDGEFPRYRTLVPGADGQDVGAAPVERIAWNPHYMADFAKLPMLGRATPIRWTFRGESKPLVAVIEGEHGTTVRAVLMPVRIPA